MRVIVVRSKGGALLKVCEDEEAYEEWLERSSFERKDVVAKNCHVFEGFE